MPRQRNQSGKSIFFEAIFVIGFLVVVGHLSVNFWEKYFIQTEIAEVKNSLNHLKRTIANIGYTYDNLNQEINGLTARAITENDLPSMHTPLVGHKYKSKYIVDRQYNNDIQVKSVIANQQFTKQNPIYKDNKAFYPVSNINDTTNTNTKIAEDVSTAMSKENATLGVKRTLITNKKSAVKAKRTIATNKKPDYFGKNTDNTNKRPTVAKSTVTPSIRPNVDAKSTITPSIRPNVDAKSTITSSTRPTVNAKSTITPNIRPTVDARSTITTNTKPVAEVNTITINRKPVSDAKSTITTNARAQVDAKSTITTNTRPDVSTITSKVKTAEDVSTITRNPQKSTAVGLCHQYEDCIHEHHCKHNNFHYPKDNECYRHAHNTLKF